VTAIVTAHTADGFVIGADGRKVNSGEKTIQSDTVQKIFPFESEVVRLAYAWTGTTEAYAENGACLYDLGRVTKRILPSVDLFGRNSWAEFISRFCEGLKTQLPICLENAPKDIAKAIFVGFFRGIPCQSEIKIAYSDSIFQPQVKIQIPAEHNKRVFTGAESAYSRYQYQRPQNNAEAISFVREYIQDCVESRESDCQAIGGHLHVAAVTPIEFFWVIPPVQEVLTRSIDGL
jgi:hypothetical protein